MKVIHPYTRLLAPVVKALEATGHEWEPRYVGGDDAAYWRLLHGLWRRGGFCVVEHDIVLRPDSLDELDDCGGDWCAFAYRYAGGTHAGLGCAKFSGTLVRQLPELLTEVGGMCDAGHPPMHWCRLDAWLSDLLRQAGVQQCVHRPPLMHLRSDRTLMPTHGCT